jgi:hypothetical protein
MQHGIREFRPRQPLDRQLSSDTLNRILRELESLRITRVVNGTFKKLPGGTEIVVGSQRGASSITESHPFKISSRKDPENENGYLVSVVPGTLNDLLPTNMFTDGKLTEFPVDSDSVSYVKLVGETDGTHQFVSCEIVVDDEQAQPQVPTAFVLPTNPEFLLGVVFNGAAYNTIDDSLVLSGQVQLTTDRAAAPLPGELPYVSWYVWAA